MENLKKIMSIGGVLLGLPALMAGLSQATDLPHGRSYLERFAVLLIGLTVALIVSSLVNISRGKDVKN